MWYFLLGLSLALPSGTCSPGCHGRFARPVRYGRSNVCIQARSWVSSNQQLPGPQVLAARPVRRPAPAADVLASAERGTGQASTVDTKVAGEPSAGVPAAREPQSRAVAKPSPEPSGNGTADADEPADSVVAVRPPRLPRFYAQLELSDEQKQQVLLIQQQYSQREAELQRQLETLLSERDAKTKQVLTRSQQRKLNQLQEERGT